MFQMLRLGILGNKLKRTLCKIKTPQISTNKGFKSSENKKNEDEQDKNDKMAKFEEDETNDKAHKTLTEQEKLLMGIANVENPKPILHILLTPEEQSLLNKQNLLPSINTNVTTTEVNLQGTSITDKLSNESPEKTKTVTDLNLSSIDIITNKIFEITNDLQKDTSACSSRDNLVLDTEKVTTFKTTSQSKEDENDKKKLISEQSLTKTNIPRIIRQEPGKVIWCVIPVEWPKFFHNTTGISGFYIFGFTFSTYLISKEIYVMEHEYYTGLSMAILCIASVKYCGATVAKTIDHYIDAYETQMKYNRGTEANTLEEQIKDEGQLQISTEAQLMLFEAKRENILFQLEENFRERQMIVYNEVKKRLDYFSALENIQRRFLHLNMVHWVTQEVLKAITPELEEQKFQQCIETLESVAKKSV